MGLSDLVTRMLRPKSAPPAQTKTSRAGPMIAWSGVGQPKWTPRRTAALAEEGFRKNVVAYRCVMQIATSSASIPWLLYDRDGNELDRHPLLDLLACPNPLQDGVSFMENVYANLQISGNAYIEAIRPNGDDEAPVELYVLRPDRMNVIPGPAGLPQGYQYSVNGRTTTWPSDPVTGACDILHLKTFHPLDDWYGMAPMEAALLSIDQHNSSGAWNQALLNQGARPSGALVYAPKDGGPATLSDDQLQRLREEMGQLYQGDRNAGRPLILEGGLDWREMSLSPKDMDWLAGRNNAARDIALAFGVPAQLIGLPDAQTYANVEQARLALYEETVLPLVTRVIAGFDHWLSPMYDDSPELDFDPDAIGALTDKRQAQWSKLQNATFLTLNEKREAAGYGPVPGGDETGDVTVDLPPNKTEAGHPVAFFNPKYSPDQPRIPAGSAGGGQWTSGAGTTGDVNGGYADIYNMTYQNPLAFIGSALFSLFTGAVEAIGEGASALGDEASGLAGDAGSATSVAEETVDAATDPASFSQVEQANDTRQRLLNFLVPDGQPIGQLGDGADVRVISGNADAAEQMFKTLSQGGEDVTPANYKGTLYEMPDSSVIGYRPISTSGPPTIDVNIEPLWGIIEKIKFVGGK